MVNVGLHHRGVDAQLLAILQSEFDRRLHHQIIDCLQRLGRQPIAAAMESIGRNPNSADRLFLPLVLSLALLEALALYGFVIAIILTGKI